MKKAYNIPTLAVVLVGATTVLCASGEPTPPPYSPVDFKAGDANPSKKTL